MSTKNRPGRPPKCRAGAIDDLLLVAARDSFCAHGVTGTSMDEIARAAGVTKQTIYRRYPSKVALIHAVVERDLALLALSGDERVDDPLEHLKVQAQRFFYFLIDDSDAEFTRFLRAEAAYSEDFRARMQSWSDIITGVMDAAVLRAQAAGSVKPGDVRHATHLICDLLCGPGHAIEYGIGDPFLGLTQDGYFNHRWDVFLRIWGVEDAAAKSTPCGVRGDSLPSVTAFAD